MKFAVVHLLIDLFNFTPGAGQFLLHSVPFGIDIDRAHDIDSELAGLAHALQQIGRKRGYEFQLVKACETAECSRPFRSTSSRAPAIRRDEKRVESFRSSIRISARADLMELTRSIRVSISSCACGSFARLSILGKILDHD